MLRLSERFSAFAHDRRVLGAFVAAGLVVCAVQFASPRFRPDRQLVDYRVFWCAGSAALGGADPYLTEPIRTCEHRNGIGALRASPNLVMPFVLPPYDVPVFAALARLPLAVSGPLFTALSALALAAGIVLVARSARVPLGLSAAALGASVGLPSLLLGQIVPLELAALAATGFALSRRRDAWAGACGAATLFAPHVGAFVVVALAVVVPRARLALGLGIAALGLTTLLAGVVRAPYLAAVGQQALAEASSGEQYSLTYALTYVHVPPGLALALGTASSAVLLAAAVLLARAAERAGLRAAAAYLPAACAVAGGTFVHLTQVALAVPAALLLFRRAEDRTARALAGTAVVLLAVPWPYPVLVKPALAPALLVLGVTVWYVSGGRLRAAAAAVLACWLLLIPIENRPPPAVPVPVLAPAPGDALASVSWGQAVRQMTPAPEPRDLFVKLPTWIALLALVAAAGRAAAHQPRARAREPGWA